MQLHSPQLTSPDYPKVRVYAAGALFNDHELLGNEWLAWGLHQVAHSWLEVILPQRNEFPEKTDRGFRSEDLLQVICTDALIISANGVDVDSGSVKEKELAGSIDHPVTIYRGDFRRGGDSLEPPSTIKDYNLMLSSGSRLSEVQWNSMISYREIIEGEHSAADVVEVSKRLALNAAEKIAGSLKDAILTESSHAASTKEGLRILHQQQFEQHQGLSQFAESRLNATVDTIIGKLVSRQLEFNEKIREQIISLPLTHPPIDRERSIAV